MIFPKEIPNARKNRIFDNIPIFVFIEKCNDASGPGTLVEPISDKAEKIFCSVGISQIESFFSGEMQLSKRDKKIFI
jgi:hypothetical protein